MNNLGIKGASMLFNTLIESKSEIKTLSLYDNKLDDKCMESMGKFIKNSQTIESIGICYNRITDKGIKTLHPYLIGNRILKRFDISQNEGITDKSIPLLNEIIQKSSIENINIEETSIINQNIFVILLIKNILINGSDIMDIYRK